MQKILRDNIQNALSELVDKWNSPEPGKKVSILDCIFMYRILIGRNPDVEIELPHLAELTDEKTYREIFGDIVASKEFQTQVSLIPSGHMLMAELADFKFWFNSSDREMGVPMGFGTYEQETVSFLKGVVTPGMVCWDIGAQTGFFTCLLSRLVGNSGEVISYEPMPNSFDLMAKNIKENGFDKIAYAFNAACSNIIGEIPMMLASKMFVVEKNAKDTIKIPCVRLDEAGHERLPDLIKIDVEGHEPAVLEGLEKVLQRCSPLLMLELNEYWLTNCSGKSSGELIRELNKLGYIVYGMEDLASPLDWQGFRQGVLGNCNVIARRLDGLFQ